MSKEKIENLKKYRTAIIYAEIGAFLHDLGKCDGDFIKKHQKNRLEEEKNYKHHTKIFEEDEKLIGDLNLWSFFNTTLDNLVLPFIPSTEGIIRKWGLASTSLKDFIEKHHYGKFRQPDENLILLTALADRKDSADDRMMPLAKQEKGDSYYKASVFGKEKEMGTDSLNKNREYFYRELASKINDLGKIDSEDSLSSFRKEIINIAYDSFKDAIAETRRSANDVSLWDHSYSTASITKAFLVQDALEHFSFNFPSDPREHWKKKLKVLGVGWETTRILGEAQDLPGISGRVQLIEKVKEKIKDILEFEIPIGNCIYEDNNCLCFLVPENIDIVLEEIKRKVVSEVVEISDGVILPVIYVNKDANPYPSKLITDVLEELNERVKVSISLDTIEIENIKWIKEWSENKGKEVCVECGKRPRVKDKDICWRCQKFRIEGVKRIKNDYPTEIQDETVWLDEIADESGNIALICASIPLEKWLDGEMLKTIFVKTLSDVLSNERKIWKESEYTQIKEKIKKCYSGVIEVLEKFLNEIHRNGYNADVKLLQPFLSDDFKLSQGKVLEATYLSLKSRFGSDDPKDWATGLFTKPPSPSRLMRIWNETHNFFVHLFNNTQVFMKNKTGYCLRLKIKPKFAENDEEFFEKGENKYQTYDLEKIEFDSRIKLPKTDLWWDGEYFYSTIRIENYTEGETLEEKQEIIKENIENLKKKDFPIILKVEKRINGKKKRVKVKVRIENIQTEKYLPVRKILISPTNYQLLVPANLSFELVESYTKNYEEKFSKVRGRLSLNFGCLLFKRKTPIFAILDGARRLVNSMKKRSSNRISLKVKKDGERLRITSKSIGIYQPTWEVNTKLGDGKKDFYYPNLFVKNKDGKKETYFEVYIGEHDEETVEAIINFSELGENEIFVYPSLFDYQFLKSSADRFKLSFINQRQHNILGKNSPRPYLLEDIEKFQRLKEIFYEIKAWSPIRDIEALAMSKRQEWSNNGDLVNKEMYKEFISSALENKLSRFFEDKENWKNNIKPFLIECIMEGSFFDAIELFKSIMKIDLKGGENE